MKHPGPATRILALVATLLTLGGALLAAPGTPPSRKPATGNDSWPKTVRFGEAGTISLDEPQAESLDGSKLKARGDLRVQRANGEGPSAGTASYEAEVRVDREERTVTLLSVEVSRVELPGARPAFQQRLATRIGGALSRLQAKLPLDDVLAETLLGSGREETAPKLNNDPPRILFETDPAILVIFDGEPRFRAVDGFRLERALNTPFLVLRDPGSQSFYLSGGTSWFRAPDPKGPWTRTDDVPSDAVQIARRDLKDAGVPDSDLEEAKRSAEKRVPKILVATEPAELIVSDGPPVWSPIVTGELEAMENSESDVFRTLPDRRYWVVLSGRWYESDAYSGPWNYVEPDRLPESFQKIPADSSKADALAFVPGTAAARGSSCRRPEAPHGRGPAERSSRDRDVRRRAALRGGAGHPRGVRLEHRGTGPQDPGPLLRLRPGRLVRVRFGDGSVASGGFDSGRRHPGDSAGEPRLQHALRVRV